MAGEAKKGQHVSGSGRGPDTGQGPPRILPWGHSACGHGVVAAPGWMGGVGPLALGAAPGGVKTSTSQSASRCGDVATGAGSRGHGGSCCRGAHGLLSVGTWAQSALGLRGAGSGGLSASAVRFWKSAHSQACWEAATRPVAQVPRLRRGTRCSPTRACCRWTRLRAGSGPGPHRGELTDCSGCLDVQRFGAVALHPGVPGTWTEATAGTRPCHLREGTSESGGAVAERRGRAHAVWRPEDCRGDTCSICWW